ncbi:hypothetical protein PspLS_06921 [Pyricularia sp. CBS 133598]|nr:hypothetical protein PspLS_06921 [Pyricularia sp. CBS 133598]
MRLNICFIAIASGLALAQPKEKVTKPEKKVRYGFCTRKWNTCTTYSWSGNSIHKTEIGCPSNPYLRCPGNGRNLCMVTWIKEPQKLLDVKCRFPKAKQVLIDNNKFWGTEPSQTGLLQHKPSMY